MKKTLTAKLFETKRRFIGRRLIKRRGTERHGTGRRAGVAVAFSAAFAAALLLVCAAGARAQSPVEDSQPPSQEQSRRAQNEAAGPDLVRALNLSLEQRAEIGRIRREVASQTRAANLRVRRARLALEEAVYGAAADEALIEQRAAEVADAEAARIRLRAQTELRIRRLLTPEQLNAFRELRTRALARRQRRQNRRLSRPRRPPRDAGQPPGESTTDDEQPPAAPPRRQPPTLRRLPDVRPGDRRLNPRRP